MFFVVSMVRHFLQNKLIVLLILFSSFLTLIMVVLDGGYGCVQSSCGYILGDNARDGVWFQTVAAVAFRTIPFRMPIFSGVPLQGYHFFPNLFTYVLSLSGISIQTWYYKVFPFLYLIVIIYILLRIGKRMGTQNHFNFFLLFFYLLGIPLTILPAVLNGYIWSLNNKLLINTFQSTRILESYPTAFSYLILFSGILVLLKKNLNFKDKWVLGMFSFLLFGFKFYTAAIFLCMVLLNELIYYLQGKQSALSFVKSVGIYFICSFVAIQLVYNPFQAAQGGSIFVFAPFATVHHVIEDHYYLYNRNLVLARYFLYAHGWSPRLVAIETLSTFLFVFFYYGARIIGLIYLLKQAALRKIDRFEISALVAILFSILLSVLFIQKGDWFNPIQFAVCGAYISSIFAARFVSDLWKYNKLLFTIVFTVVIIATVPSNLFNLKYVTSDSRFVITYEEIKALQILRTLPDGTVFIPITQDDSTYVQALTGKPSYINFVSVLSNTNIAYQPRLREVQDIYHLQPNKLNISYAYLLKKSVNFPILSRTFISSRRYKVLVDNSAVLLLQKKK